MKIRSLVVLVHIFHTLCSALVTCALLLPFAAARGVFSALPVFAVVIRLASGGCFIALVFVAIATCLAHAHPENLDERRRVLLPLLILGAVYFLMWSVSGLLFSVLHVSTLQATLWILGHVQIFWMYKKPSPPSPPAGEPDFLDVDGKRYTLVPATRHQKGVR